MFENIVIYYFSGTGNARNVTNWIADTALEKNKQVEIIDISKIDRKNISDPPTDSLIGFCSPTHGFNYPPVMMYFIFRFPKANGNKAFLINTRAGAKFSKIFFPGLSGIALLLPALVLFLKGYKIIGMRPIDLPSNWISLHPGLNESAVSEIQHRCKRIVKNFADKILDGKKNYRALFDIIQDLLIAPIAVLYFFVGRFVLAKTFYADSKCDNCDLCLNNCPVKAIEKVDNRPFWTFRCESCMRCMNECPKRAIETGHGYIIGLLYLIDVTVIVWLGMLSSKYINLPADLPFRGLIVFTLESLISIVLLVPGYWLIHYLNKLPVFRQLIEYTSLTKLKFWNRYKSAKKFR